MSIFSRLSVRLVALMEYASLDPTGLAREANIDVTTIHACVGNDAVLSDELLNRIASSRRLTTSGLRWLATGDGVAPKEIRSKYSRLATCPWCGCDPDVDTYLNGDPEDLPIYRVTISCEQTDDCPVCPCSFGARSLATALDQWNTRIAS